MASFVFSTVFQMAHVTDKVAMVNVESRQEIENEWAVHQLATTADFAPGNRFIAWYTGGLNYQVEHHLFSHISHVHYPALREIIRNTCHEYQVSYYCFPTFWAAFKGHFRLLKALPAA